MSENEIMANLLDNVENSVWHAFDHLALEGDGTAPKAKLKVGHIRIPFKHNFQNRMENGCIRCIDIGASYIECIILLSYEVG